MLRKLRGRGLSPHEKGAAMTNTNSADTITHTLLRAEGFSCPSCVGKIEKQVGRIDGVDAVTVHFASGRVEIDHDAKKVSVDELIAAVDKAGFKSKASAF